MSRVKVGVEQEKRTSKDKEQEQGGQMDVVIISIQLGARIGNRRYIMRNAKKRAWRQAMTAQESQLLTEPRLLPIAEYGLRTRPLFDH